MGTLMLPHREAPRHLQLELPRLLLEPPLRLESRRLELLTLLVGERRLGGRKKAA